MITAEREEELAAKYGLNKVPEARYELPKPNQPVDSRGLITFKKAVMLVDPIRTAAFTRYLPPGVFIDQSLDGHVWHPEQSFAWSVRTDVPPPVTEKITNATGIKSEVSEEGYMLWLSRILWEAWQAVGAKSMAPPLVWHAGNRKWRRDPNKVARGIVPLMGLCCRFIKGAPPADYGAIVPFSQGITIAEGHEAVLDTSETK